MIAPDISATGGAGPDARELRQTRDYTAREKRMLLARWRPLCWPGGAGRGYAVAYYLFHGFAAFFLLSLAMAIRGLGGTQDSLALQIAFSAAACAASGIAFIWLGRQLQAELFWRNARAGDVYALGTEGIGVAHGDGIYLCGWTTSETVVDSEETMIVALKRGRALLLAKAAFGDQDVAGFCAELKRRWAQHRGGGTQR